MKKFINNFHSKLIYNRRVKRLTELIIPLIHKSKNILDVGCGDGIIDKYIQEQNKKVKIQGIDVMIQPRVFIEIKKYDGITIPFKTNSFDTSMAVDVFHHTDDPNILLAELSRVSSQYIIIKDHLKSGIFSYLKLRLMDYVGNHHKHVHLTYNYMSLKQWKKMFAENGLKIKKFETDLNIYTGIFHLFFDRKLHFIAVLEKNEN